MRMETKPAVRVQIAGVSTLEEALEAERAGADALGFTLRLPSGVHDELTEARARSIVNCMPPFIATVCITYVATAREAADLCRYVGVSAVQLHGDFPVQELPLLRAAMPNLKIIKAVHVTGPDTLQQARPYVRKVDALILDTYDPDTGRGGATGKTHDWNLSRQLVDTLQTPIILAGGLTPENVAQAVRTVRPWAVDVHTGVENPDGSRNFTRLHQFVRAAKHAWEEPDGEG